jgi:diaminohydroxyphosphoribosylaminopyrimidine deaminase / 5-amino-6-(5-phosphoribosylamino)uracil reductase
VINELDEKYMRLCFELAGKGGGYVSPNPLVGALIVKDGRIISTGFHERYGGPHAEINAINSAGQDLKGATLYCNLEPCVHTAKQTPPCAPAIIAFGITKAVIANNDPNPEVRGNGIIALRDAGIEVVSGLLETEGNELNRFYFKSIKERVPYVTLKMAVSEDGKISASEGTQTWLTGSESGEYVHRQRSVYDAVLVGANTIRIDDPRLTVRNIEGRNPIRIIIDGALNTALNSKVYNCGESRTIVFCSSSADCNKKKKFVLGGIEIIELEPDSSGRLDLALILKKLGELKIASLFVEGGREIFDQFIERRLFDEITVLKAPVNLGSGVDAVKIEKLEDLTLVNTGLLGKDAIRVYRLKESGYVHRNN